jgi:PAS domain-containing protein
MAQHPVELILLRHLASRSAIPIFIVDTAGDLVYFNEPAERVLGRRFDEIRVMPIEEWTTAFAPAHLGTPVAVDDVPLVVALRRVIPVHDRLDIMGGDGVERTIEVTAFPILAAPDRCLGAVAMFWEPHDR